MKGQFAVTSFKYNVIENKSNLIAQLEKQV